MGMPSGQNSAVRFLKKKGVRKEVHHINLGLKNGEKCGIIMEMFYEMKL